MIPLTLELKNFLSYGEGHPPLSLEGIHVACLSGPNGNGKSALLDAMVWALWGEPRGGARSGDDLIRHGASEMQVSLDLDMDGSRYRVTRKRTRRNKTGSTELQFEGWDGEMWRPLAEGSIGQTQDAINRLIRMTHDTFVHASFVQQGKADAFMLITPQQRKQVLGDILGLGVYDELADAARDAGREARSHQELVTSQIRAIEAELAKRDEYAKRLEDATALERASRELVERMTGERTELMREVERLSGLERQAAEKKAAQHTAQERVMSLERQLGELTQQVATAQALAAKAEEIEQQFAQHQQADEQERAMADRFEEWCGARDDLNAAQAAVDRERIRLEADRAAAERNAKDAQERVAQAAGAEERAAKLEAELATLDTADQQHAEARKAWEDANGKLAVLQREGERIKQEPPKVLQRIEMLGENKECPLCGQALGVEGLVAARNRLQGELQDYEDQLMKVRKQYAAQQSIAKAAQELVKQLQEQVAARASLEHERGSISTLLKRAEEDRKTLAEAQQHAQQLGQILAADDFAHEARARLAPLQARIVEIGYDEERHKALRASKDRLKEAPTRMRALDAARARLETAATHRLGLETQLEGARDEAKQLAEEGAALAREAARLPEIRTALATKEAELQTAAAALRQSSQDVGEARQMVGWLAAKEKEAVDLARQRDAHAADVTAYTQLAEAFGKNGIQEMVVEQALPEIEEIANEHLARLTNGRMQVTIHVRREGRTANTSVSTLDVRIRDELGDRPYELFSGGEKFRINFAVRIALSKLLARRANAPLQMLAIDEGFGSQDREGCDRLIEAIRSIQDDFKKVLVITHLEEMKDAFPVRIEVSKGPSGSTFTIG